MSWLISVPVWGEKYIHTFVNYAWPALREAVINLNEPVRFLIHTDDPDAIRRSVGGYELETRTPHQDLSYPYIALQYAHSDAIKEGRIDERVVLLNADIVVSNNLLRSCSQHFEKGMRAVVLIGIRTVLSYEPNSPYYGYNPRSLLNWAWAHRHQIIKDLEWGTGCSFLPTNLFFNCPNGDVIAHVFHQHPVAIVKSKEYDFKSTIDGDLLDHFDRHTIHVVTDPDDMSMLEISETSKRFPVGDRPMTPHSVAASMRSRASPLHKWLFQHKITVIGDSGSCEVSGIVQQINAAMSD